MPYLARKLITRAWFLSGIVARNLQTVTGDQMYDGLDMLNDLLNFKQIDTPLIPYYQYITFDCVPHQEYYYLPHVASIESATFDWESVRFSMTPLLEQAYYATSRANNIFTLPVTYNYKRDEGGGVMALYPIPDRVYPMKLQAKIFLSNVDLDTDLMEAQISFDDVSDIPNYTPYTYLNGKLGGFDTGYIEYLRCALAEYMCQEYSLETPPGLAKTLKTYQRKLMYVSAPDLSMRKSSILGSNKVNGMTWADVSLGRGWRPS